MEKKQRKLPVDLKYSIHINRKNEERHIERKVIRSVCVACSLSPKIKVRISDATEETDTESATVENRNKLLRRRRAIKIVAHKQPKPSSSPKCDFIAQRSSLIRHFDNSCKTSSALCSL